MLALVNSDNLNFVNPEPIPVQGSVLSNTLDKAFIFMLDTVAEYFTYMRLQVLVSGDGRCICFADYKTAQYSALQELPLENNVRLGLEMSFTQARKRLLNKQGHAWNKARLIVNSNKHYCFEYYFDHDLEWLRTVDMKDPIYQSLSVETQQQIVSWSGLSKRHPRPWVS